MCRQLTIIAESLPVREIFSVNVEREAKRHAIIQTEAMQTLPKREILCLTRAASLQNRLGKEDGTEMNRSSEQRYARRKQRNKKRFE